MSHAIYTYMILLLPMTIYYIGTYWQVFILMKIGEGKQKKKKNGARYVNVVYPSSNWVKKL